MNFLILFLIALVIIIIMAVVNKYSCKHEYEVVCSFNITWTSLGGEFNNTIYCTRCRLCGNKQIDGDKDILDEGRSGIIDKWLDGTVTDEILKSIGK